MSATAGAAAGAAALAGGAIATGVATPIIDYFANKHLMELEQDFNANQALKQRKWEANQAQIQRDWQTSANKIAMDFSHDEAIAQREWEHMMSSTAHRREMADLRKAGLNPILAANNTGASTPSGATASGVAVSPAPTPSGSNAHSRGASVHFDHRALVDFVGNYLSSAHKLSMQADKFQHEREMLEKRQAYQLRRNDIPLKEIKSDGKARFF